MAVKLIQIGNSKAVKIPNHIIDKYSLDQELEIIESKDGIIIKPVSIGHKDWDQKFKDAKKLLSSSDKFSNIQAIEKDFINPEWI